LKRTLRGDAYAARQINSLIEGIEDYYNHFFKFLMTLATDPNKEALKEKWLASFVDTLFSVL
jgi:hypothetical protein